ncbi:mitochondrial carrier protein [Histoplasma capsulatum G186AR]|uniref:Mitochondrial carrier protein n=2 Tax=Ajellomyces capsulatus TaxID=5037 RepID=C0NH63_AJECG|nr:mitochondrial carrier protein [Histoplasma capsulatum G186AR]EEH09148.1 mitochondrial carrier protein [Histoplasma capsulatum G186AR]KAG5303528.1 mitochondrial carrier protein [Histoplasma capsulatum]QSS69125.1 mitochondrial carrier protein [Histoplasma capsulatum G186AR]
MSNDFWAGYLSGAIGIVIGNPLDLLKTRLQAGQAATGSLRSSQGFRSHFDTVGSLVRGATAPIVGYGALNAILFVAYNRTLTGIASQPVSDTTNPVGVPLYQIWVAGAVGGLASWVISSPTELVKCRAQLATHQSISSWTVTKDIWKSRGFRGLYYGGGVTSIRDSVGYGFYFWSYELCKRLMTTADESSEQAAAKILICGGIAGIITWVSIFPLDVIKTRLQVQGSPGSLASGSLVERQTLLRPFGIDGRTLGTLAVAKEAYRTEGFQVFYRGLGVCSLRAFIVNAVQWAMYEWTMKFLK